MSLLSGLLGVALVSLGVVYLVVACQNLPGFLGPTPGDASPRTILGLVVLALGLASLAGAGVVSLRRSS